MKNRIKIILLLVALNLTNTYSQEKINTDELIGYWMPDE